MKFSSTIKEALSQHKVDVETKELPFIIGARFKSGVPVETILVMDADDGYFLGRVKLAKGRFSETVRTYNTDSIEYWEKV